MAIHKAKVIGPHKVGGVATGGTVELDDEVVNVAALVSGGNVELIPAPESKPAKAAVKPKAGA